MSSGRSLANGGFQVSPVHQHSGRRNRPDRRGTTRVIDPDTHSTGGAVPGRAPIRNSGEHVDTGSGDLKSWLLIIAAMACAVPWFIYLSVGDVVSGPPIMIAIMTGGGILGAAFLLSWAAEVFQLDVSQALALALLALIAVLPEYAVDAVFAWNAASDPTQAAYAVANMTGSNRLLVGFGWGAVVVVAWLRSRGRAKLSRSAAQTTDDGTVVNGVVTLPPEQALELVVLAIASVYSLVIPFKGQIDLFDAGFLVTLFCVYAWATSRLPSGDPHLVGPAATVGKLRPSVRRAVMGALFVFATAVIFMSAHYFADGLVRTGKSFGIDEFVLVQWLAPLASEAPEFLVALLFAWRGLAGAGLRTLISSTVNQWTLLVGTLGVVFRIGQHYAVNPTVGAGLPLDMRQTEELLLTSALSLFALAMIANFELSIRGAAALLGFFLFQLVGAQIVTDRTAFQSVMIASFLTGAVYLISTSRDRREALMRVPSILRSSLGFGTAAR